MASIWPIDEHDIYFISVDTIVSHRKQHKVVVTPIDHVADTPVLEKQLNPLADVGTDTHSASKLSPNSAGQRGKSLPEESNNEASARRSARGKEKENVL
jgi:hypothetical protein